MFDLYSEITDRIIKELEAGEIPWHKPWASTGRLAISHGTGKPYSLLNQMLLGKRPGEYITYRECQNEGGHVRKGEKASFVVFWKWLEGKDKDTDETILIPYLRYYNVFHIGQCEGINRRYTSLPQEPGINLKPDEKADRIIEDYRLRTGVTVTINKSNDAYYSPGSDTIVLPELKQYSDLAEFYSTAYHEMTHSTGHPSRLNRLKDAAPHHSFGYSKEELVAEIGSAFLLNYSGLETPSSFRNSAAYVQGWLKSLRNDKKLIVSAAGAAEKAVKFILNEMEDLPRERDE